MHDVIVIGGGHNGLVCAAYLARAGLDVLVLERRGILGGAAVTEEFHPGFRNSTASYTVSLLNPKIIRDLDLARHGLAVVERPVSNYLPVPGGRGLTLGGGPDATLKAVAAVSPKDAERLPAFHRMLEAVADELRALLFVTPPAPGRGLSDYFSALAVGRRLRNLDPAARRDVLELFTRSAGDMLDHWFESDIVRAAFGRCAGGPCVV